VAGFRGGGKQRAVAKVIRPLLAIERPVSTGVPVPEANSKFNFPERLKVTPTGPLSGWPWWSRSMPENLMRRGTGEVDVPLATDPA